MITTESRGIKINLQIKRRRDIVDSPSNNKVKQQLPNTKSTNHSKKLNVTVHHRHQQKNSMPKNHQEEPKKIVISQFRVEQDSTHGIFPQSLHHSRQKNREIQNKQNLSFQPTPQPSARQWWQQALIKPKIQKKEIIDLILKKEAQIDFYQNLLEEKNSVFIEDIWMKQKKYEEYIQSLISVYQSQLQKNKQLSKDLQEQQFQKKRQVINLEGKMGLNFSPKQLSTFSGMSGGSILLDSVPKHQNHSGALKKKRSELFSFGSSNKLERSQSYNKQTQMVPFLNPGRALLQRGKKIAFE